MPSYFIRSTDRTGDLIVISGETARHLSGALRAKPQEEIFLVDERRTRYTAKIEQVDRNKITVRILSSSLAPARLQTLTVAQGLLKGDKMDWVIQKVTELGVDRIVPLITARTIKRPPQERRLRQQSRWERVALEAAQQSGRDTIPRVDPPLAFETYLKEPADLKIIFWEKEIRAPAALFGDLASAPATISILLGPEGGFSKGEVAVAREAGYRSTSLGPRTLRAETAAVVGISLVQFLWGDLV